MYVFIIIIMFSMIIIFWIFGPTSDGEKFGESREVLRVAHVWVFSIQFLETTW